LFSTCAGRLQTRAAIWHRHGPLSHVFKLFLIDRRGSVREIYSTSFLQPEVVLNDIRTQLLEDSAAAK
jgi:hypothetical protein